MNQKKKQRPSSGPKESAIRPTEPTTTSPAFAPPRKNRLAVSLSLLLLVAWVFALAILGLVVNFG